MNELQIFRNDNFGEIRVTEVNGEPYFCLVDICRALELTNPSAVRQRLYPNGLQLIDTHALNNNEGGNSMTNFINEPNLYKCIFQSRKPDAEKFQDWVFTEVLPSIRKTGSFSMPKTYKEALQHLLAEVEKNETLQLENKQLSDENTYKTQVIEGLTEEIPLADMRQRITQIMAKAGAGDFGAAYRLLYQEFDKKYHINVGLRMSNVKCKHKNYLDYIERELHMIPELYELTCKLFESDYQKLINSWGKAVRRARGARRN